MIFNVQEFKNREVHGRANYQSTNQTMVLEFQTGSDFHYYRMISKQGSPYHLDIEYYSNLNLKSWDVVFYNLAVGFSYKYDEKGNLVKKNDTDQPYKFTVQDLINLFKKKYRMDLSVKVDGMHIERQYIKVKKRYEYSIRFFTTEGRPRYIDIDGETGEILRDFLGPHGVED